jgi:hypothetical protein
VAAWHSLSGEAERAKWKWHALHGVHGGTERPDDGLRKIVVSGLGRWGVGSDAVGRNQSRGRDRDGSRQIGVRTLDSLHPMGRRIGYVPNMPKGRECLP